MNTLHSLQNILQERCQLLQVSTRTIQKQCIVFNVSKLYILEVIHEIENPLSETL